MTAATTGVSVSVAALNALGRFDTGGLAIAKIDTDIDMVVVEQPHHGIFNARVAVAGRVPVEVCYDDRILQPGSSS